MVRHGLTQANIDDMYCGHTNLPLSEPGKAAITALKEQGIYPNATNLTMHFYASALRRTQDTLAHIYGPVDMTVLEAFNEIHFGDFEMRHYDELKDDSSYQAWVAGDDTTPCPGGESMAVFKKRVIAAFEQFATEMEARPPQEETLLVAHGGVISAIMGHYFGVKEHFYEWMPHNGRGYTLTIEHRVPTGYVVI